MGGGIQEIEMLNRRWETTLEKQSCEEHEYQF